MMQLKSSAPADVYYIVQSKGDRGERDHLLRSVPYETQAQAETELRRLRAADVTGAASCGIWRSTTHVDPAEWLHRVVRCDGTLILPRLKDTQRYADAGAG